MAQLQPLPYLSPQALWLRMVARDQVGRRMRTGGICLGLVAQERSRLLHLVPVSFSGIGGGVKPQKPGESNLSLCLCLLLSIPIYALLLSLPLLLPALTTRIRQQEWDGSQSLPKSWSPDR